MFTAQREFILPATSLTEEGFTPGGRLAPCGRAARSSYKRKQSPESLFQAISLNSPMSYQLISNTPLYDLV